MISYTPWNSSRFCETYTKSINLTGHNIKGDLHSHGFYELQVWNVSFVRWKLRQSSWKNLITFNKNTEHSKWDLKKDTIIYICVLRYHSRYIGDTRIAITYIHTGCWELKSTSYNMNCHAIVVQLSDHGWLVNFHAIVVQISHHIIFTL